MERNQEVALDAAIKLHGRGTILAIVREIWCDQRAQIDPVWITSGIADQILESLAVSEKTTRLNIEQLVW
jgi:hypothetical protein